MCEKKKRSYAAPEMEMLSLTVEPLMLDEGLTVGEFDNNDIEPLKASGAWTPWV